jgi:hypothetical protein
VRQSGTDGLRLRNLAKKASAQLRDPKLDKRYSIHKETGAGKKLNPYLRKDRLPDEEHRARNIFHKKKLKTTDRLAHQSIDQELMAEQSIDAGKPSYEEFV